LIPIDARLQRDVSVSLTKLGDFYVARGQAGDAEEALRCFQQSLATVQQLREANPNSAQAARDMLVSLERLADLTAAAAGQEAVERALQLQLQAVQLARQLHEANPASVFFGRTNAVSLFKTFQRALAAGDRELAGQCLAACHALLHELVTAGCQLDPPVMALYRQLHAQLGQTG
jgi:hypothetical protein